MTDVFPVPYSKSKSQAELVAHSIKAAPKQDPNSPAAFYGNVFEYSLNGKTFHPVGTLSEIHTFGVEDSEYNIVCKNGNVIVRYDEGEFILKKVTVTRK